jgi:hypothetical protein
MKCRSLAVHLLVTLSCGIFSGNACGETSATYVHYECFAGEKPGSLKYELIVLGSEYRVEQSSPIFPVPNHRRTAYGSISTADRSELAHMMPGLVKAFETLRKLPARAIAGYCSWDIEVDGMTALVGFQNTQTLGPELRDFIAWIRKRSPQDASKQVVLPIIPGEPAPWNP